MTIRPNRSTFQSAFLAGTFFLVTSTLLQASEPAALPIGTNATTQNAEDQFRLGRTYYRGEGVKQSYELAGEWYRKSADQGNLKAMHNLGILFLEGKGTPKNEAEGYRWLRTAAEKGDPSSAYLTGILLIKGEGVAKNSTEGVSWLKKATDAGDANALARLGQDTYFGDDGIKKDPNTALPLIQAAAEKGNPWACDTLGLFYLHGELVPKDEKKANEWFSKGKHNAAQLPPPLLQR